MSTRLVYTGEVLGDKTLRSPSPRAGQAGASTGASGAASGGEQTDLDSPHIDEHAALLLLTGGLSTLRSERVQAHASGCDECRRLIDRVAHWSESTRDRYLGPSWRGAALPPGVLLSDRYRIVRFIARGGMGEVYEVRDEALDAPIALKTVAAHHAGDSDAIGQLKAEVQLARRVSHRNVCRIYDLGLHVPSNGPSIVFLTMEFIEGTCLGERLRAEGRLAVPEARHVTVSILEGLLAAHEAGVLHRDLKSDNVMLRLGRHGELSPVLMDFGLASALNPNSSRVSGDQALVGSLAYMAPEQVQGEALRIATDLYAVGVMLFEMLTGRLPFVASTPALAALKRLQEDAPRLREVDPDLPEDLERIVARCLERDPKRRYQSALEVLLELDPAGRHPVVSSGAPRQPSEPQAGPPPSADRSEQVSLQETSQRRGVRAGRARWVWLSVLALAAGLWWWRGREPETTADSTKRDPTAVPPADDSAPTMNGAERPAESAATDVRPQQAASSPREPTRSQDPASPEATVSPQPSVIPQAAETADDSEAITKSAGAEAGSRRSPRPDPEGAGAVPRSPGSVAPRDVPEAQGANSRPAQSPSPAAASLTAAPIATSTSTTMPPRTATSAAAPPNPAASSPRAPCPPELMCD